MSPEAVENLVRTDMQKLADAFGVLGQIVRISGRRKYRAEAEIRMHLRQPEQYNKARITPMPRRAVRRARVLELRAEAKKQARLDAKNNGTSVALKKRDLRDRFIFRPVIGYVSLAGTDAFSRVGHKDVIAAMKFSWLHRNDKKPALPGGRVEKSVADAFKAKLDAAGVSLPKSDLGEVQ